MKQIGLLFLIAMFTFSCKNTTENAEATNDTSVSNVEEVKYSSFGMKISDSDALSAERMATHYETMNVGDSINSKMIAKVESVCQVKGCWMRLDLGDGKEAMVKFKDYGFFMPKDISGREVVVNGQAFVNEISVDELRHYAEDAGETAEEIAKITEPKRTYSFLADGVLLKE